MKIIQCLFTVAGFFRKMHIVAVRNYMNIFNRLITRKFFYFFQGELIMNDQGIMKFTQNNSLNAFVGFCINGFNVMNN